MLVLFIYIVVILLITCFEKRELFKGVFKTSKKTTWFISGISLFMYYVTVEQGQVITGILSAQGMWGLWIFWSSLLGAFVLPFVFAPLWSKLDFITDNQFLLFRFSGFGAKVLHAFRAFYVGGIVVAILLSYHILAFSRVIEIYFHFDKFSSILITGSILILFALKNSFQIKLKTDFFHSFIYFLVLFTASYYLYTASGGLKVAIDNFKHSGPFKLNLFPPSEVKFAWTSWFAFVFIQWWSAQMFDGGGPEMARFTAVKGKRNAILTALFPILLYAFLFFFLVIMAILVLSIQQTNLGESQFIYTIFNCVPEFFKIVCLVGFFGMFITTAESQLSWGGAFLTIDLYKKYLNPKQTEKHIQFISFFSMLLLSVCGVVIAFNVNSLQAVLKIVFSISAGVAPVYILRWFWFRINAWSQLSAMISSGVYTLLFPYFFNTNSVIYGFAFEEARLIIVTVLTTFTWLLVTFLTKKDDEEIIARMKKIVPDKKTLCKQFALAFGCGFAVLLIVLFVWKLILM
jgi:Na+/proline symporter